jgi:transcriptional regulator with XRE-family HTH domain
MSDPNTLGSLVRRRRLESGYSLGQLASKVGKTAAEVRAWERDNELPEHGILERLAETLELDLDEIKQLLEAEQEAAVTEKTKAAAAEEAGDDDPVAEQPIGIEAAEEDAADSGSAKVADVPVETPEDLEQSDVEPASDPAGAAVVDIAAADVPGDEGDDDQPGFAVDDPFTPPTPDEDDEAFSLLNAPTEAVPVPIITETAAAARAGRAAAVIEEPAPPLPVVEPAPDADPGLLRYLEPLRMLFDPQSRYLYWIRAGLTIIVLLVFAVILFDQLGKLLDAVGELLDTIEPAATNPDELDAFAG